jgi:hypothetical protein
MKIEEQTISPLSAAMGVGLSAIVKSLPRFERTSLGLVDAVGSGLLLRIGWLPRVGIFDRAWEPTHARAHCRLHPSLTVRTRFTEAGANGK